MQAAKHSASNFFFLIIHCQFAIWTGTWCQRAVRAPSCKSTAPHWHGPAQQAAAFLLLFRELSTADLPAGEGNATQQCMLPGYVPHTRFASWGQSRGTEATCLLLHFSAGGQQRNGPLKSLLQWARSAWELLQPSESHGLWSLVWQPGLCEGFACKPDRFYDAYLGTDITFDNYIDCSIF